MPIANGTRLQVAFQSVTASEKSGDSARGVVNHLVHTNTQPTTGPLNWLWVHGFRFLFVIDALVLFTTLVAINVARFGSTWPNYPVSHYLFGFCVATMLQLLINYFSGLYEREPRLGSRPWLARVSSAMALGVALDGLVALLFDRYLMPRLNLGVLLVIGSILLTGTRYFSRQLADRRRGAARVFLVGKAVDREQARLALSRPESAGTVVGETESVISLCDKVSKADATDVLLLDLTAFSAAFPEPITALDQLGVGLHQRVSAAETLLGLRTIGELGGIPITRLRPHALARHQKRLKRVIDLLLVIGSSFIWLPIIGFLALYVRTIAGKQVFYHQTRVGLDGTLFTIHKFRTMVRGAEEESGPRLSEEGDVRVLRGARWLRRTRLDEVPQFWNVIVGDMSLVGPRPERPEMIKQISRSTEGYARRHSITPGLTGLAQIKGKYETNPAHKLGYDLQYLVNWSPALDFVILLRSIVKIISK